MSILKDINDLGDGLKIVLISQLILPFWYVSIYLFHQDFFNSSSFATITIFCFSINFVLSMFTIIHSVSTFKIYPLKQDLQSENNNKSSINNDIRVALNNVMIQVETLSVLIFITYSCGFFIGKVLYFYWFIIVYIFLLALNLIYSRSRRKKQYQDESDYH